MSNYPTNQPNHYGHPPTPTYVQAPPYGSPPGSSYPTAPYPIQNYAVPPYYDPGPVNPTTYQYPGAYGVPLHPSCHYPTGYPTQNVYPTATYPDPQHHSHNYHTNHKEDWIPSVEEGIQIEAWFFELDKHLKGVVGGLEVVNFLKKSNLPRETLRTIWSLVDDPVKGCVDRHQFKVIIRLVAIACSSTYAGSVPCLSRYYSTIKDYIPLPSMKEEHKISVPQPQQHEKKNENQIVTDESDEFVDFVSALPSSDSKLMPENSLPLMSNEQIISNDPFEILSTNVENAIEIDQDNDDFVFQTAPIQVESIKSLELESLSLPTVDLIVKKTPPLNVAEDEPPQQNNTVKTDGTVYPPVHEDPSTVLSTQSEMAAQPIVNAPKSNVNMSFFDELVEQDMVAYQEDWDEFEEGKSTQVQLNVTNELNQNTTTTEPPLNHVEKIIEPLPVETSMDVSVPVTVPISEMDLLNFDDMEIVTEPVPVTLASTNISTDSKMEDDEFGGFEEASSIVGKMVDSNAMNTNPVVKNNVLEEFGGFTEAAKTIQNDNLLDFDSLSFPTFPVSVSTLTNHTSNDQFNFLDLDANGFIQDDFGDFESHVNEPEPVNPQHVHDPFKVPIVQNQVKVEASVVIKTTTPAATPSLPLPVNARTGSGFTVPLSIESLTALKRLLFEKHYYEECYICQRHLTQSMKIQQLQLQKKVALENDELELALKIKKDVVAMEKTLVLESEELKWIGIANDINRKGESLIEMHESLKDLEPKTAQRFQTRYKNELNQVSTRSPPTTMEDIEQCLLAKRSAEILRIILIEYPTRPKQWMQLIMIIDKEIQSGIDWIQSKFLSLNSSDQRVVKSHEKMIQYVNGLQAVAEVGLFVCTVCYESLMHDKFDIEKVYEQCQSVLKCIGNDWNTKSQYSEVSIRQLSVQNALSNSAHSNVIMCNLTLRAIAIGRKDSGPISPQLEGVQLLYPSVSFFKNNLFIKPALNLWNHKIRKDFM